MRVVQRKEAAYEQARRSTMWNANVPERFPDEVIYASSAEDVIAAVNRAKERGLTVGVRSGGHGWSGNHVRDGGVLLDLSAMTKFSVDKQNMTAIVEPALSGSTLLTKLMKENLFFPVGHCKGVGLGGYLLQGGFGWNGRALGLACESVLAIDYVDADGKKQQYEPDSDMDFIAFKELMKKEWGSRPRPSWFRRLCCNYHLLL